MEVKLTEHGVAAGKTYQERRPHLERMAESLRSLLTTCLIGLPTHVIEARAKSLESFVRKASKVTAITDGTPKYSDPLNEITDLVGVRIITYFPNSIPSVEEVLSREFDVIERSDKSKAFEKSGRLGYQSVHFLVRLREPRLGLPEYRPFAGQVAEIQVRTILQHAWAEMEHDIQYKSSDEIPTEIRRRFASLAGLIEIADREFQAIQDSDQELRRQIRNSLDLMSDPTGSGAGIGVGLSGSEGLEAQLQRYSDLVRNEPNQYAHYLGRAKVRFLLGDRVGAIADLDLAEGLSPGNQHLVSARKRIDQGFVAAPQTNESARKVLHEVMARLSRGDGEGALEQADLAVALGSDLPYVHLDRAMALCLLRRYEEALKSLGNIHAYEGSFMQVDVIAMECIVAALDGREPPLEKLKAAMGGLSRQFDLSFSPLRHLRSGLIAKDPASAKLVDQVFAMLEIN